MIRPRRKSSARRSESRPSPSDEASDSLPMKAVADRLVMAATGELLGPDVLVLLLHGTTLATGLRQTRPELNYTFYTPEHFFLTTLSQFHPECHSTAESDSAHVIMEAMADDGTSRIRLVCAPDPPEQEFDSIAFPTNAISSSEQTQELLQSAHLRLRIGGRLVVSTNNPKDKWLHERLRELFDKVSVSNHRDGVVYVARKATPLKKVRNFQSAFAFRFREQLVSLTSRPGVFSHRRIDAGARALIRSLELLQNPAIEFQPRHIADLGCGCGAVAVAAALQYPEARILAVDSHARAVECAAESAAANHIDRVETLLCSNAVLPDPEQWDLVLTNPPYYSDFRISELFLQAARASLRSDGRIHLVTKLTDWHQERMSQIFRDVTVHRIGEYDVLTALKY